MHENNSLSLIIFLEKIRSLRNFSQEHLIHGIVSMRQYRRYINGTCKPSYDIIKSLFEKLGFNIADLLYSY